MNAGLYQMLLLRRLVGFRRKARDWWSRVLRVYFLTHPHHEIAAVVRLYISRTLGSHLTER